MTEHTPTPWAYRPNRFDDWGFIRGPSKGPGNWGDLAAIAKGGDRKSHDEHRQDGTDPYAANAALILRAVNNHDFLVKALTDLLDACESIGIFRNGVEHNGIDEGEVHVSGLIDQARDALTCVGISGDTQ